MSVLTENNYSGIFKLGAAWNLAVGLGSLTLFRTSMRLFFGRDAVTDSVVATMPLRFFYIAIAIFGWGYYLVSKDLKKNRGIVWMGIICKVIIFAFFAYYFRLKKLRLLPMLAACVDLVFTFLFGMFLIDDKIPDNS
jgi:hypothetical protein